MMNMNMFIITIVSEILISCCQAFGGMQNVNQNLKREKE